MASSMKPFIFAALRASFRRSHLEGKKIIPVEPVILLTM